MSSFFLFQPHRYGEVNPLTLGDNLYLGVSRYLMCVNTITLDPCTRNFGNASAYTPIYTGSGLPAFIPDATGNVRMMCEFMRMFYKDFSFFSFFFFFIHVIDSGRFFYHNDEYKNTGHLMDSTASTCYDFDGNKVAPHATYKTYIAR
jgi:hypothetical protein